MTQNFLLICLLTINASAFLLMLVDKRRARKKLWRIPEATLMLCAALGGSPGILAGMYIARHKTRKPKFYIGVPVILVIQLVFALWLMGK